MSPVTWFAIAMLAGLTAVIVTFEVLIPWRDRRLAAKLATPAESGNVYPKSPGDSRYLSEAQRHNDIRVDLAHIDRNLRALHRRLSLVMLAVVGLTITIVIGRR